MRNGRVPSGYGRDCSWPRSQNRVPANSVAYLEYTHVSGLWYISLGFPLGMNRKRRKASSCLQFRIWRSCDPFNQKATISPPPVIVTTAVAVSTMSAATATIGPRRPTAVTTVTTSTSIRATGTGTTTIGLTASPCGLSPKHLQASGSLPSFLHVPFPDDHH